MKRRIWSQADIALLIDLYPHHPTIDIEHHFPTDVQGINSKAGQMKLRKAYDYKTHAAQQSKAANRRTHKNTQFPINVEKNRGTTCKVS